MFGAKKAKARSVIGFGRTPKMVPISGDALLSNPAAPACDWSESSPMTGSACGRLRRFRQNPHPSVSGSPG